MQASGGEVEDAGTRGGMNAPRGWAAWSSEPCSALGGGRTCLQAHGLDFISTFEFRR